MARGQALFSIFTSATLALASLNALAAAPAPAGDGDEDAPAEAASAPKIGVAKGPPPSSDESSDRPVPQVFRLPPSSLKDPYGPRPDGVPKITRRQVLDFGLQNPLVAAAGDEVEAMQALLLQAKFAWVPAIKTTTAIAPGVATRCDDFQIALFNPKTNTTSNEDFQYCRPVDGVDIDTLRGYFNQIAHAGITVRFQADTVVPLYTFGKIKSAKQMATAGVALAELNQERLRQETALRVYQAHSTLLLARGSIDILEEAWNVIREARVTVETDLGMGEDPDNEENLERDPADLTRIELGELELEERLLEARKIEALALAALWAIAGEAAPPGFDIAETDLLADGVNGGLKTADFYREMAAQERPEAKMSGAVIELRRGAERLARANFLPDIGLILSAQVGYSSSADPAMKALYYYDRYNYSRVLAALGVSWNLDFHNAAFRLKKARAERRAAEHQREAALLLLGLEVDRAYRDLVQAQRAIEVTAQASKKSRQLVVDLQVKETVGGGNLKELERALTRWAEWRFKHYQAIMTHNSALASLSRAVGAALVADPA
ncbi:MAG: TolC family protein [Nannocystaceae bacterium]